MGYQIGTTLVGLVTVTSLGLKNPKSTFKPYSELIPLGNGKMRGAGLPVATWNFGFLTQTQRDALRVYCTGASANVFIETRKTDSSDVFDQFSAIMIWPEEEERDNFIRLDFTVEFRQLVEA